MLCAFVDIFLALLHLVSTLLGFHNNLVVASVIPFRECLGELACLQPTGFELQLS